MTRIAIALLSWCLLVLPAAVGSAVPTDDPPKEKPKDGKPPAGVDPKMTSDDADYGFTKDKPVKVGSKDEFGGPAAERAYLDGLRDADGKPVKYKRLGSVGAGSDGHILDLYLVTTSADKEFKLYLDMYHPENDPAKQLAPKGFYKVKKID